MITTAYPLSEYETDELLEFLIDAAVERSTLHDEGQYEQADQISSFIQQLRTEVTSR